MSDYVLFQLAPWTRQSLISRHQFYIDQARKRLLSQFENMESEADQAAENWLKRSSSRFNPDAHDPADFYEAAHDAGIEFYGLLSDMRDQTHLSVVAGMFHEWDKQLRDWLVREVKRWHRGETFPRRIWKANFSEIAELSDSLGWDVSATDYYRTLDACRLVVNVYKHGVGGSLDELKRKYPEYLDDPLKDTALATWGDDHRDYTYLRVSEDQLTAFSDAIVAFWKAVPENTWQSKINESPSWVEKALSKDRSEQTSSN